MNVEEIKARAIQKRPIKEAEKAALIANDGAAFWAFLISQNAGNINDTLKYKLGYDFLPFTPDAIKIGGVIGKMIEANHTEKLNAILNNYQFKPGAVISAEIKQALQTRINLG